MLIGLVSALSMGVIERTREVGILRCVGARARYIRRVFSAEAMILAIAGRAFGVLLGWLIYQGLLALLLHDAALSLPQESRVAILNTTLRTVGRPAELRDQLFAKTLAVKTRGPLADPNRVFAGPQVQQATLIGADHPSIGRRVVVEVQIPGASWA